MEKPVLFTFVVVISLAIVLDIVALATPEWVTRRDNRQFGLFQSCFDRSCRYYEYSYRGTGVNITTAFTILTLLALLYVLYMGVVTMLDREKSAKIAGIMSIVASLLNLAAVIASVIAVGSEVGYSFGMACTVTPLCIIACVLAFIHIKIDNKLHMVVTV